MEERSVMKREIDLGENFDVAVKVNGARIEVGADGSVLVYTNNAVKVLPPSNDDAPLVAGVSPDTGRALYVMPQDAPLTMKWKEAMQYAANLDAHGHKDWRLPSKAELNVLFQNRAKIGEFDTGGYPGSYYWSCTEHASDSSGAWTQRFADGDGGWGRKDSGELSVRCVRAEPAAL